MRKRILLLIVVLLLNGLALAATDTSARPDDTSVYISEGDYGHPIDELLALLGCEGAETAAGEPVFDAASRAVLEAYQEKHGLEVTGCFDPETLCLLLGCPSDAREVWIPMHGGDKYHDQPDCSGMLYPCLVPVGCAEACGYAACENCCE